MNELIKFWFLIEENNSIFS